MLARRVLQTSVLLIICRSRVRAPPAPPAVLCRHRSIRDWFVDRRNLLLCSLPRWSSGHIEQLPSGSRRARVYVGEGPLSGRDLRFRKTRRTEVEAQIELGKLFALARNAPTSRAPANRAPSIATSLTCGQPARRADGMGAGGLVTGASFWALRRPCLIRSGAPGGVVQGRSAGRRGPGKGPSAHRE